MICLNDKTFFITHNVNKGEIIEIEKSKINEEYCYVYYKGHIIDYIPVYSLTYVMSYNDWLALEREKQIKLVLDD